MDEKIVGAFFVASALFFAWGWIPRKEEVSKVVSASVVATKSFIPAPSNVIPKDLKIILEEKIPNNTKAIQDIIAIMQEQAIPKDVFADMLAAIGFDGPFPDPPKGFAYFGTEDGKGIVLKKVKT